MKGEEADEDTSSQYEVVDEDDNDSLQTENDEDGSQETDDDSLEEDEEELSDEDEYAEEYYDESSCDLLTDKLDLPENLSPQFYKFYQDFTNSMDFIIKYEYNL